MDDFESSYLGKLRKIVGDRLLLMPGARIIIIDREQQILLQKRSDFGVWGLPGGNSEEGENILSTIKREVKEETGLLILEAHAFGYGSNPDTETFTFPNGDRTHFFH